MKQLNDEKTIREDQLRSSDHESLLRLSRFLKMNLHPDLPQREMAEKVHDQILKMRKS